DGHRERGAQQHVRASRARGARPADRSRRPRPQDRSRRRGDGGVASSAFTLRLVASRDDEDVEGEEVGRGGDAGGADGGGDGDGFRVLTRSQTASISAGEARWTFVPRAASSSSRASNRAVNLSLAAARAASA